MNCLCCLIKSLTTALKNLTVTISNPSSCEIPQPLEINGNVSTNIDIPNPLPITGSITTMISNNPLEITGSITTSSTLDPCLEGMTKILSATSSFQEIVFKNGDKYQSVNDLTVNDYIVTFTNQKTKIQTTVCNIEYVSLE